MGIRPHGSMIVKVGDTLSIEVENKQNVKNPLSLKVFGDINLEAEGADVALKGKNVKISADSQLSLISNDIFVGDTEGACGIVKIATGTLKTDTFFIKSAYLGNLTVTSLLKSTVELKLCDIVSKEKLWYLWCVDLKKFTLGFPWVK